MPKDTRLHQVFCDNVRRRRLELELTQHDVAKRLDVSQPAYAAIEAGRCSPSLDTVQRVAEALECNPAQLLLEPQPVGAH